VCAAASAAAFACDGTGSAASVAKATASAYAAAVASVTATCVLAGDATASVKASAEARAKAEVWVSAYFDAIASAATCGTCKAWASSWGYIEKWVFLEAIAKAEVKVCCIFHFLVFFFSRRIRCAKATSHLIVNNFVDPFH
jgi:hypothetical protein